MNVSASKVSTLCTSSELALVMASRPPELNRHTHAELKRLVLRARKLCDKASDQGRSKARAKSRRFGAGSVAPRTFLKIPGVCRRAPEFRDSAGKTRARTDRGGRSGTA